MARRSYPSGYQKTTWKRVRPNELIYLLGSANGNPHAYGPFEVIDPSTKKLRNIAQAKTFSHPSENLLIKDGPHLVITFDDDEFTGCYADVPAYVTFVYQGPDMGDFPGMKSHRPKTLESISDNHKKLLDKKVPKWRELFGKWDLQNTAESESVKPEEPLQDFQLDNLLAVTALSTELIKQGKQFTVTKVPSRLSKRQFSVPTDTMDFIRRYCEGLTDV